MPSVFWMLLQGIKSLCKNVRISQPRTDTERMQKTGTTLWLSGLRHLTENEAPSLMVYTDEPHTSCNMRPTRNQSCWRSVYCQELYGTGVMQHASHKQSELLKACILPGIILKWTLYMKCNSIYRCIKANISLRTWPAKTILCRTPPRLAG
jgi:hypothetical protein